MDILQRRPDLLQGPIFSKIASISDVASLSKEERIQYEEHLRQYRDTIAVLEGQYQDGVKDGMEKGKKDGLLYAAIKMRTMGIADEQIMSSLGLTAEDLQSI